MKYKCFNIGKQEHVQLHTYILDSAANGKKRPMIIICPGGGFLDCSPFEGECVAMRFCNNGYHAAVLYYSTKASNPENSAHPQAIYDLAESICLIRKYANEWDVDKNKIAILGFSAGANVCATYGNWWSTERLQEVGTVETRKPNAAILCYPLIDFRLAQPAEINETVDMNLSSVTGKQNACYQMNEFWKMVNMATFGCECPPKDLVEEASPVLGISENTPPTFLWHTFDDPLISPTQTLEYAGLLYKYKIPCELHIYEEGKHGLSLADKTSAKKESDINTHVATWSDLAIQWLDKQFLQY